MRAPIPRASSRLSTTTRRRVRAFGCPMLRIIRRGQAMLDQARLDSAQEYGQGDPEVIDHQAERGQGGNGPASLHRGHERAAQGVAERRLRHAPFDPPAAELLAEAGTPGWPEPTGQAPMGWGPSSIC